MGAHLAVVKTVLTIAPCAKNQYGRRIGIHHVVRPARRHYYSFTRTSLHGKTSPGFIAGFFLCMREAGEISILWAAGFSRLASLLATGTFVLATRQFQPVLRAGISLGILAGMLDSTGSAMFVRASQTGRLDAAVVISSLYPAVTVLLARFLLDEHVSHWRAVGLLAALLAVPLIAM